MKAVLLDVDGTLIDSNDAHTDAWMEAFRSEGMMVDREVVRRSIGMGGDQLLPKVSGVQEDSERGQRLAKKRAEVFQEKYLPHLNAFDGSLSLLKALKARGYELVVASSASKKDGQALLKRFGFDEVIDAMTCSADVENSKPAPDIIEVALKKAKVEASEAFMLGDTPYDIRAAARAGVATIAFTCGGWSPEELKGAAKVYAGPAELLANLDQLKLLS